MSGKKNGRGLFYNKVFLRVLSLALAVLLWLVVVLHVSPNSQHRVSGVAITFSENEPYLTSLGLHIVGNSSKTVSITLSGPRYLIGRYQADDFSVVPNYSGIGKTGTYTVPLVATMNSPDNRVHIVQVNPASISVRFDTLLTKTLSVQPVMPGNYKVPKGYLLQTLQAVPATVTVSGPTSELKQVTGAVANVSIREGATQTTQVTSEVSLVDASGKEVDQSHMQLSSNTVQVTVPILKTAAAALTVGFSNLPDGFDASNLTYTVTPAKISVAGDKDKVDGLQSIALGTIDFSTLGIDTNETLAVPDLDGLMNRDNITSAVVSIHLHNIAQKTVSAKTFTFVNVPQNRSARVLTSVLTGVRLFGPSASIGSVNAVTGVIDVSKADNATGQFELPVTFTVPGHTGFWVQGSYQAVVEVSKK